MGSMKENGDRLEERERERRKGETRGWTGFGLGWGEPLKNRPGSRRGFRLFCRRDPLLIFAH